MCDGRVSSLQNTLQSVATRVPKLVVQRVEDLFPALKEIVDSVYSQKDVHMLCLQSEACSSSSSHDGGQAINMKVEKLSHVQDGQVPVTVEGIKAECENCWESQTAISGSHSEACSSSSHSGDEAVSIKSEESSHVQDVEDPVPVAIIGMKAEHENCLESQKDILVPGSHSEAYPSSPSDNGNQAVRIKVEECSDMEVWEDPVPITFVGIKTEHEACAQPQEDAPGSYIETRPVSSHDEICTINIKVEESSDVEVEEDPLPISFPGIKAENESLQNEHPHIHSESQFLRDLCSKSFTQSSGLKRQHINAVDRPFSCNVCNKSFIRHAHLKEHQRIHSGERPYSCGVCNKSFSQYNHLKEHKRMHSGERPYSCEVCSRSFKRRSYLKSHQHTHSGERAFFCPVCNKSFTTKSGLRIHKRIHSEERPFSCAICNRSYISKYQVKVHLRRHTGERPYSCDKCNKSYTSSCNLKVHLRMHSGERPFSCAVCNESYASKNQLKEHLRKHSGK